MLSDNLKRWGGEEGGGREFKSEGHMHTYGQFTLVYGRNQHDTLKQLLPGPGIKLMRTAPAGGFLSTGPPGKSPLRPSRAKSLQFTTLWAIARQAPLSMGFFRQE